MMTLYLTFEALAEGRLSYGTQIPVSDNAAEQSPTKLGLRPGQTLTVRDAVLGLITKSANDAACALAEAMARVLAMGPEARAAMGRAAEARIASKFTAAALQRATLDVYDRLIGRQA
jgi:D-alanyl-D-alanine carboxypeptidase